MEIEENKGKEEPKKEVEVQDVSLDKTDAKIVETLLQRISQLEANQKNPQASSAPGNEEFFKKLIDRLDGRGDITEAGQFKFTSAYSESDIDADDVLPEKEWVTFICHRMLYVISDDKRYGKAVPAPYGLIGFRYLTSKRVRSGREESIINLCSYVCKSRKEVEWLRAHSMYEIMFFDNIRDAIDSNVERATALAKQMIAMQGYGQQQIVSMAKSRGLPISSNLSEMKAMIANSVVDDHIERSKTVTQRALEEKQAEEELMK